MKKIYKYFLLLFTIFFVGPFIALTIKMSVGVAAWDAFNQAFSNFTGIKVGSIVFLTNAFCVLIQIIILRKKFNPIQLLQFPLSLLVGFSVNLFYYNVFTFEINMYIYRLILFIFSTSMIAFLVSFVLSLDIITFPVEAMCMAISEKTNYSFVKIRFFVDVVSIMFAIILPLISGQLIPIREGTLLGMIIFSPLLAHFMAFHNNVLNRI